MSNYIPDALDFARWHEEDVARAEARLPVCDSCGEIITEDEYYNVDGEILCEECAKEAFRSFHKCDDCGVECSEYYDVNGMTFCEDCFNDRYRRDTSEYDD